MDVLRGLLAGGPIRDSQVVVVLLRGSQTTISPSTRRVSRSRLREGCIQGLSGIDHGVEEIPDMVGDKTKSARGESNRGNLSAPSLEVLETRATERRQLRGRGASIEIHGDNNRVMIETTTQRVVQESSNERY